MSTGAIAVGEPIRTDVLVIGGGLAGHRAAIAAARLGVSVTLAYPGRGASPFIIGCNAPLSHADAHDSPQAYFDDMVRGGYGLNDRRLVRVVAEEAANGVRELLEAGVPLARDGDRLRQRHLSGNRYPRSVYHPAGFGAKALAVLARECRRHGVAAVTGHKAVRLLVDDGEVCGALLQPRRARELRPAFARAVVLATGGAGRVYADSTYPPDICADSYALALEAGATLIDMEFVQFEPTVACHPLSVAGLEMPTAMLGDGAQLLNARSERFMFRYNPEFGETRLEKARLALCIQQEIDDGRGLPGGGVLFDTTCVPAEKLESYVAHCRRLRAGGVEPGREGVEIRPAAHSQMGGVRIDADGWSGVPGLYAGGESAGGVHGASRLAGNGGSDAMVLGAVAGRGAARSCTIGRSRKWSAIVKRSLETLPVADAGRDAPTPEEVKSRIGSVMSSHAGIYRSASSLHAGLESLASLSATLAHGLHVAGGSTRYAAYEARSMVLAARCVLAGALAREESRGAHQRRDFPGIDDERFRLHIGFSRGVAPGDIVASTIPIS